MEFKFTVSPEGMNFIKENELFFYEIVRYDEKESTITLELPEPDNSSIGQFMSVIKENGLLIGKDGCGFIIMSSKHIVGYPYELEAF